jgi:hypothetical protein
VNCTLTLSSSKVRVDNSAADIRDYVADSHFLANFSAAESIATSSAQNDSGLFVVNFNDERYLPFEGAGAISTWQLSMPQDNNAFDFDTITDVIFNLRYTARDGGPTLRAIASAAAVLPPGSQVGGASSSQTSSPQQQTLTRLFSLRHEFPTDWNTFLYPPDQTAPDQTMTINITQDRFPFQYRGKRIQIYQVALFLKFRDMYDPNTFAADGTPLGEYVKGSAALTVDVAPAGTPPPGTPVQLVSKPAVLAGVPYGPLPSPPPRVPPVPAPLGVLGQWKLTAPGPSIASLPPTLQKQLTTGTTTVTRLVPELIDDIVVLCQYSTQSP